MPYPSYIPAKDSAFASWLANFSTLLTASPTTYGLTAGDATAVSVVNSEFQSAYTLAIDPATRTSVTVAAKDNARSTATSVVRPLAQQISLNQGVSADDKVAIGVSPRNKVPTPIPAPVVAPVMTVDSSLNLVVTCRQQNPATPTSSPLPLARRLE